MLKISIWERLDIKNDVIKRSEFLSKEEERFEKVVRPQAEKKSVEIGEVVWDLYEKWRKAKVVGGGDPDLAGKFSRASHDQEEVMAAGNRGISSVRREQEDLMHPLIAECILMIDDELDRLPARYICKVPAVRVHPITGRELPGERTDINTEQKWLDIETNAPAILMAQEILIKGKSTIRRARSVRELEMALGNLEKAFSQIIFDALPTSVKFEDFERTSTNRPVDVAFLMASGEEIKLREPQAAAKSIGVGDFFSPKR
jgi:hypothetical protein